MLPMKDTVSAIQQNNKYIYFPFLFLANILSKDTTKKQNNVITNTILQI